MQYIIENITYKTGETRIDGHYPQRIGSIVRLYPLTEGRCAILDYVKDNEGNDKEGYIRTSTVVKYDHRIRNGIHIIETLNSVFYLRECE